MPEIESAVIRVVAEVSERLAPRLADGWEPRALAPTAATESLLHDLRRPGLAALETYLDSPDFATVVAQQRIGNTMGKAAKDQLYQGLRLAGLTDALLRRTTEVLHDVMVAACQEAAPQFGGTSAKIDRGDLFASAAGNSLMLQRLKSSARVHAFAAKLRDQVAALHNRIRMPHIGISRSVRYDQLYVEPTLAAPFALRLGAPGERVLVLGDPGAGKSTLAAKFAHDIAVDGSGRVPFLLVLREFTTSFREGGRDLVHHLEKLCQAPYNVKPPRDGVEYLLRTGRAVVILDGLDELVQTELRRRITSLVEGFAHLYPLVPILVTARKIGYEDAPLSDDLFVQGTIAEFGEEQVSGYVTRWFLLDEATSPAERERLCASFMRDSRQIPELRSNPLLLTLLCAMYSSDRYLPRNLAQVYERCALMLFEQWDSRRGIPLPLKFHGRLRGAVQHLAWQMFTARESGKALRRNRILHTLTEYLEAKLDDRDEALATAEQFLEFCTGRAWILTDVGATETEPRFGFTHRTFLEYFAAEHLVRTHRTAAGLWDALRPSIAQWEVVAQIVLQLYDRNVEGGADELLAEAIAGYGLDFAARSLHHLDPSTRTVRAITEHALRKSAAVSVDERAQMGMGNVFTVDQALHHCLFESSPANRPAVEDTLRSGLAAMLEDREPGAVVLLECMLQSAAATRDDAWVAIRRELNQRYAGIIGEQTKASPWGAVFHYHEIQTLQQIVQRFGARSFYLSWSCYKITIHSPGLGYLNSRFHGMPSTSADLLATTMAAQPTPWASIDEFAKAERLLDGDLTEHTNSLTLMLSLPFLELYGGRTSQRLPSSYTQLMRGRGDSSELDTTTRWLEELELPVSVREFLRSWVRGEISVTASDPLQPIRPPAPR